MIVLQPSALHSPISWPTEFRSLHDTGKSSVQRIQLLHPRRARACRVVARRGFASRRQSDGSCSSKSIVTSPWRLGVVLYKRVTGQAPFTGEKPGEVMSPILEKEPPPLANYIAHITVELQEIISKTLRKNRE